MTAPAAGFGLAGRRAVVLGVADEASIAWAIATALRTHGARVHIGYQQRFFSRVRLLLRDHPDVTGARCDVTQPEEMRAFFAAFADDPIDILIHAVAYGPPEIFANAVTDVSRDAFSETLAVSAHSLGAVVHHAAPSLRDGGSVQTLSFQAAERAVPMYGMMGVAKAALESMVRYLAIDLGPRRIRVNAISPGPIETLAALGIIRALEASSRTLGSSVADAVRQAAHDSAVPAGDDVAASRNAWRRFEESVTRRCAMPEGITKEDVAGAALFLASDYSRKITGQVLRVDAGLSSSLIL